MAAGGFFADSNQPIVHATEAVQFGWQVIKALEKVNQETGSKLRIRVGIKQEDQLLHV
jgi:hypothetical protein